MKPTKKSVMQALANCSVVATVAGQNTQANFDKSVPALLAAGWQPNEDGSLYVRPISAGQEHYLKRPKILDRRVGKIEFRSARYIYRFADERGADAESSASIKDLVISSCGTGFDLPLCGNGMIQYRPA